MPDAACRNRGGSLRMQAQRLVQTVAVFKLAASNAMS